MCAPTPVTGPVLFVGLLGSEKSLKKTQHADAVNQVAISRNVPSPECLVKPLMFGLSKKILKNPNGLYTLILVGMIPPYPRHTFCFFFNLKIVEQLGGFCRVVGLQRHDANRIDSRFTKRIWDKPVGLSNKWECSWINYQPQLVSRDF